MCIIKFNDVLVRGGDEHMNTTKKKNVSTDLAFRRRKRKQNLSVPLEEDTIAKLKEASARYKMSRAELMRFALEYAIKSVGFHDLLKQMQ
jgi:hypothetical protein